MMNTTGLYLKNPLFINGNFGYFPSFMRDFLHRADALVCIVVVLMRRNQGFVLADSKRMVL